MPSYLTVYPDPDPETLTFDGLAYRATSFTTKTWADIRDGAGTASNDSATTVLGPRVFSVSVTDHWRWISRPELLFDCRALTSAAIISAAALNLRGTAVTDAFTESFVICAAAPGSNVAAANTDYEAMVNLTTPFSSTFAMSGWNAAGYNVIALNAAGIAAIVKSGDTTAMTKLGLRCNSDITNTPPTWIASSESTVTWRSADYANLTSDPYLYITYTVGGAAYTLTAATGVFTLTGLAAGMRVARRLTAATSVFTLTGNAAVLRRGYTLVAATGSFMLSGMGAGLKAARRLVAATGAFTLSGSAAALSKGYILTAARGIFTLTGMAALLTWVERRRSRDRGLTASMATRGLSADMAERGLTTTVLVHGLSATTAERGLSATMADRDLSVIEESGPP